MRRKFKVLAAIIIILGIVIGVCFFYLISQNRASVFSENADQITIVLDPGHGGFDGGAVSKDGTSEKDINLKIALELRDIMKEYPIEVVMTREVDEALKCEGLEVGSKAMDLRRRKEIIEENNADLTISIHLNSYPSDELVYGAQVFYSKREQKRTTKDECEQLSKTYAENIQKSLEINIPDGRERKAMAKNDTYLFKNIDTPIILVECGFLSNHDECNNLKRAEYQRLLAETIWEGINTSLQLEKKQKIQIIQGANKLKKEK